MWQGGYRVAAAGDQAGPVRFDQESGRSSPECTQHVLVGVEDGQYHHDGRTGELAESATNPFPGTAAGLIAPLPLSQLPSIWMVRRW